MLGRGQVQAPNHSRRTKYRHGSARTVGRTHHFLPAPLHFTSTSQAAFPFHCVPSVANCRDRQRQRCARRFQRPRCSAYRPSSNTALGSACRRRQAIWPRGFARPGRCMLRLPITVRSVISAPPPFRKLHCVRQKRPNSLDKPNWSETPSLDSAACCLGLPWSPQIRPAFRSVPSAGTQNITQDSNRPRDFVRPSPAIRAQGVACRPSKATWRDAPHVAPDQH